jgi:hypothetical protein
VEGREVDGERWTDNARSWCHRCRRCRARALLNLGFRAELPLRPGPAGWECGEAAAAGSEPPGGALAWSRASGRTWRGAGTPRGALASLNGRPGPSAPSGPDSQRPCPGAPHRAARAVRTPGSSSPARTLRPGGPMGGPFNY